jgi:hypothetical protein
MGLRAAWLTCATPNCHRSNLVSFESLHLPDDMLFSTVARSRKWVCSACGGRQVEVTPDWATGLLGWDRPFDAL